jgi:DUF1680 family protein
MDDEKSEPKITFRVSRRLVNIALASAAFGVMAPISRGRTELTKVGGRAEPRREFEHGAPLSEFGYRDVSLERGVHESQLAQTHGVLMSLDEDSLLRPFRFRANLPAPGFELGGWYSSHQTNAGHSFGQWISALSRYYAITGHQETRAKVFRLLQGYSATIEPTGKFFTSRYGQSSGVAMPYIYDKLACGMMDAHQFVGHPQSLGMLAKVTQIAQPHLSDGESYTIPENQFIAWQRGGDALHLEVGKKYLAEDFFEPLARGENVLADKHAYSHVNAMCSAAKAYLVLGDEKYLRAAENGFAFLERQSFATGAWGPTERFFPASRVHVTEGEFAGMDLPEITSLAQSLARSTNHFETPCGGYAHFKLTRYLLRITKESRYGDSMERIMYNTVLGALPLSKYGKAFYYSNYHSAARKEYLNADFSWGDEWPCCSGTLPQIAADYRISTYFKDARGVYVNLYIPSTLEWEQGNAKVSLAQSGQYPLDDRISFVITASRSSRFAIRLRIPNWAVEPIVRINGEGALQGVKAGSFATLEREWKSGDRVELHLPRRLELKAVDEKHPDKVALTYGPLVLFALSDDTPRVTRSQLLAARQKAPGSEEWITESSHGRLSFVPWWVIGKEQTYFTYFSA